MSARGLMGRWSAQDIRRVAKIAWPTILENIMVIMVSFVDTAMVGQLGEDATAAVAVNASPSWLLNGACAAIQVGATVLVAQAIGSRDREGANKVARQAMTLGLCMGAFLMVLMMAISGWLPAALRAEARIVPVAAQYIRIVAASYIPHFTGLVISGILRGTGDTKTPMKVNLAANVVNIIGNFFLIYESRTVSIFGLSIPVWGAGLGVVGAAIPSAFSMAMVGVVLFIRVVRGAGDIRFERHQSYRPRWNVVRNMLRIGMPAAMERVCVNAGHMIFQTMVAGLGTASLAAHHLATTAESLSYMPAYGFGVSATTLVGQAVGAGDTESARRYGSLTILIGFIGMTCTGLVLMLFPEALLGMFTNAQDVIALGAPALRVEALAQPFFALSIVASGALSGAGDTRTPMIIGLACMWGVRLSVAALCIYGFGMGLTGAWVGMATDLTVRGILTFARFRSPKWEKIAVVNVNA